MTTEGEDSKTMVEPGEPRDELVRCALADSLGPPLPDDFAQRTALFARTRLKRVWGVAELVMLTAFIATLGLCFSGLRRIAGDGDFLVLKNVMNMVGSLTLEPWLVAGIGCLALTRVLAFGLRARL